jgi:mannose-6-phosphate isomerase-like protein (cupin superfamily)
MGKAAEMTSTVDLSRVLSTFEEPWSPGTVAVLNDYDVRVVKTKGEFTRHSHPDTDEFFLVLRGSLTIKMDAGDVELGPGHMYVVPRGVQHQPVSAEGAEVVLIAERDGEHWRHPQRLHRRAAPDDVIASFPSADL